MNTIDNYFCVCDPFWVYLLPTIYNVLRPCEPSKCFANDVPMEYRATIGQRIKRFVVYCLHVFVNYWLLLFIVCLKLLIDVLGQVSNITSDILSDFPICHQISNFGPDLLQKDFDKYKTNPKNCFQAILCFFCKSDDLTSWKCWNVCVCVCVSAFWKYWKCVFWVFKLNLTHLAFVFWGFVIFKVRSVGILKLWPFTKFPFFYFFKLWNLAT